MAAPAAAPAIPAAAITGGLILLAFAWVSLYGLKYGYDYSFGALLRKLADETRGIRWVGGKIAATFAAMDSWIMARIADGIDSVEAAVARLWDGLAWLVRETGDALVAFGQDVQDAIRGIVLGEIPTQIGANTKPITDRLSGEIASTDARLRAERLARSRGIDELNRDLTREQLARERGIDRLNDRLRELVMPRIRALDQALTDVWGFTRRNLRTRIGNLERAAAAGAIGAVAIAALTRVFPWWQCSNVRRLGKRACGMDPSLLDALLLGTLLVVGPISLVAFARELQGIIGPVSEGVRGSIRET